MNNDRGVKPVLALLSEGILDTEYGEFLMSVFHDGHDEAVVLSRGNLKGQESVLCRIHSECLSAHVFSGVICDCKQQMAKSQHLILEEGRGLIIYLAQEGRGCGAAAHAATLNLKRNGMDQGKAYKIVGFPEDTRRYDIAAKVIDYLGIRSIKLVSSNAKKIEAMKKHSIDVSSTINLQGYFTILGPAIRNIAGETEEGLQQPIMKPGENWVLVIGDLNTDYVIPAKNIGGIKGQILVMGEPRVGGTAFNAAIAFKGKGFEPVIFGKIGDDKEGLIIQEEIEKRKITTLAGISNTQPTGSCFVIFEQDTQQRLLIQEATNSNDYDLDNLTLALQLCQVQRDHFIFLVGHFLVRLDKESAKQLVKKVAQTGAGIILDLVPHDMYEHITLDYLNEIMNGYAHVLIGEYNAFMRFIGHQHIKPMPDNDDWGELFEKFRSDILVVRCGIGNISHQIIGRRKRAKDITNRDIGNVIMRLNPRKLQELQEFLDQRFSTADELNKLSADLGIDLVSHENTRQLINSCNDHGLLPQLIVKIKRERPNISWPDWLQGYQILQDEPTGYEQLTPEQRRGFGDVLVADLFSKFSSQILDTNTTYDVFLSYSRQDKKTMQRIHKSLEDSNLRVWIDETGIEQGTPDWKKTIEAAIVASKCLVAILSPESKNSRWVNEELGIADTHMIRIFPILANGDDKTAIPMGLINTHRADIRDVNKYDKEVANLIDGIFAHIQSYQI